MQRAMLATAVMILGATLSACVSVHTVRSAGYGPPPMGCCRAVGTAPGAGYVWTDGYWDRKEDRWYWVEGKWERPPREGAVWVPGYWTEPRHGQWTFHPGHWE